MAEVLEAPTITQQEVKHLKPGVFHRSLQFDRASANPEARTVEVAFASETPYERWWGVEILGLTANEVRIGRLLSGGAVLCDHDPTDVVGVIESARIDPDRVGRAIVRFGKSERAEEVFQDVIDGIRRNISVGYMIHKATLVDVNDEVETYRVTDWEPYEVSFVAVPADATVGVGRSTASGTEPDPREQTQATPIAQAKSTPAAEPTQPITETRIMAEVIDAPEVNAKPDAAQPQNHQREIGKIAAAYRERYPGIDKLATDAIVAGHSVDQFRASAMEFLSNQPKPTNDIGLTERERNEYSFMRAIRAMASVKEGKGVPKDCGFEMAASRAYAEKAEKDPQGIFVPPDVLFYGAAQRDLNVTTSTAGGNLVATQLLAGSFIEMLRNKMVVMGMGARMLDNLVGNIAIPRMTGGATAYWVAESGAPTESQQAFDQVTMSPKTIGAFTDISRKLLIQSSVGIENLVRQDLATVIALELQRVAINGSGTAPEPRGILNVAGIGSVAGGTNGLAPTRDHIVNLETEVAIDNADMGNLAYLTNTKVRGKAKRTFIDSPGSGQTLWQGGATPLNEYACGVTNAVPSNLTKGTSSGVCSAIIFGNWAELFIGFWSGLDLTVDNLTQATSGTLRLVALQDADVATRHVESFAAMVDALTV